MKLAIEGNVSAVDDKGEQLKYMFRVSPLVQGSGVFMFVTYCFGYERDRKNKTERSILAKNLRDKHTALWQRYHTWLETL